jgi:nitrate/TMAO reductase-like tetraheme cytochrome c subunit
MKLPGFLSARSAGPSSSPLVRFIWIVAGGYLLILALAAGLASWTATPSMCASCHEIAPAVASWKTSAHARVGCPECHEPVRPWYRFPETFLFRAQMLKRDVDAHRLNPDASSLTTAAANLRPVPDENCLQCHDLVREVTPPTGLIIDHAKHVERNKSCVSCHRWTAHPPTDAEKPLLMMAQCFQCHGRAPGSKAPGTCTECHPKSFSMRPLSHRDQKAWLDTHGKVAKADRRQCVMCHDESFCTGCHGLAMPHPAGWVKQGGTLTGGTPQHAAVAKQNPQVCVQCHGTYPNLCSMCHHKGLGATAGTWAKNHVPTVNQRGAAFCMTCHDELFCFTCHGRAGGPSAPTSP